MNDIDFSDEEDRGVTQSARLRRICTATDDDEPEDILLGYLNHRSLSAKENSTKGNDKPGSSFVAPRDDAKDCEPSRAQAVVAMLDPRLSDRDEGQSARMRRMCSATDDDEPEEVLLELLNVRNSMKARPNSSGSKPGKFPDHVDDLEVTNVADDWEEDSSSVHLSAGARLPTDVQLDFVDRSKFLYNSPVGSKSMQSIKTRPSSVERPMLKTSSMYNVQTTPVRLRRQEEPCSPGLLPSAKKSSYEFSEEKGEEKFNSEEEFINESETEFAYVNALFSKIRHNRIGYVTGELEKGCDPSIRDANGNTMLHICAQNNLKKIAKICIQFNCDINAINNDGRTPLDICDKLQFQAMGDWLIFMGGENGVLIAGS